MSFLSEIDKALSFSAKFDDSYCLYLLDWLCHLSFWHFTKFIFFCVCLSARTTAWEFNMIGLSASLWCSGIP